MDLLWYVLNLHIKTLLIYTDEKGGLNAQEQSPPVSMACDLYSVLFSFSFHKI